MSRKRPSQSGFKACAMKKSRSSGPSYPIQNWQDDITELPNHQKVDQSSNRQDLSRLSGVKVYSPADYVREHSLSTGIEPVPPPTDQFYIPYPPSLSDSASVRSLPLATPTSEEPHCMLPNTGETSRQNNQFSPSLCNSVSMLALGFQKLGNLETPWDPNPSFSAYPEQLVEITSTTAEIYSIASPDAFANKALIDDAGLPLLCENMSTLQPEDVQRYEQKTVQASRPIAPKVTKPEKHNMHNASSDQTITYCSADGIMKEARAIPKSTRERPLREGLKCTQCDEKPLGFHGQHELQRHIENIHAVHRKAWICIDISPNKDFLSGCRKCDMQKRYGASYNAAEHLRRAHFHKKPRARQCTGKGNDQRARDDSKSRTSSSELKRWMQEVTDFVPNNMPYCEVTSSAKMLSYCNDFDAITDGKEKSQQTSDVGCRPSSLSQSVLAGHRLPNFSTAIEDSQPLSFIACNGQPALNLSETATLHATLSDPFPYSAFVDNESSSNYEPFVFDSDFPNVQTVNFANIPLQH